MTENKIPQLTLNPTETAVEMPTLTLTPEAPATPAVPEEKKAVEPVVLDDSMLTEEEKAAVEEFSKKIDIRDTNQILQYGAAAQKKVAAFSDSALEGVRTKDLGPTGDMIAELEADKEKTKAGITGIEIAARIIKECKPYCQGVHIMSLGWESKIPALMEQAGL